jgi:mono/diheme cytochrome c family protein
MNMKKLNGYNKQINYLAVVVLAMFFSQFVRGADYPEPGNATNGAKTWAENCSRCHNARDPRDLRDDQWITSVFHMRIRGGLTGGQSRDVLTFLQGSNGTPVHTSVGLTTQLEPGTSTMSGTEIYNQTCVACHGVNGKGTVPGAPNLSRSGGVMSQSDDVLFLHVRDGFKSPGSAMAMPAKGGNFNLNDADIRGVVNYLRNEFGR